MKDKCVLCGTEKKYGACPNPDCAIVVPEHGYPAAPNERPKVTDTRLQVVESTQLDRIEAKLDTLLAKKKPKPRKRLTSNPEFETWWVIYPKKVDRIGSLRTWNRIKPDHIMLIDDTKMRLKCDNKWIEGYAPNPKTYLNGERWMDELTPIPKKKHSEDPDRQHHPTYDPSAEVIIPAGQSPYEDM